MTLLLQSWIVKHGLGGKTDGKLKAAGRFSAMRHDKCRIVTLAQQRPYSSLQAISCCKWCERSDLA